MAENKDNNRVDRRFSQRQSIGDPHNEGSQSQVDYGSGSQLDAMEDDMEDDDLEKDDESVSRVDEEEDDDMDDSDNGDNPQKDHQGNHGF